MQTIKKNTRFSKIIKPVKLVSRQKNRPKRSLKKLVKKVSANVKKSNTFRKNKGQNKNKKNKFVGKRRFHSKISKSQLNYKKKGILKHHPIRPTSRARTALIRNLFTLLIKRGQRFTAFRHFKKFCFLIKKQHKGRSSELLVNALRFLTPSVQFRKVRKSGSTYSLPSLFISRKKSSAIAAKWLIQSARSRSGVKNFGHGLFVELNEFLSKRGDAINKKKIWYQQAEQSRPLSHYLHSYTFWRSELSIFNSPTPYANRFNELLRARKTSLIRMYSIWVFFVEKFMGLVNHGFHTRLKNFLRNSSAQKALLLAESIKRIKIKRNCFKNFLALKQFAKPAFLKLFKFIRFCLRPRKIKRKLKFTKLGNVGVKYNQVLNIFKAKHAYVEKFLKELRFEPIQVNFLEVPALGFKRIEERVNKMHLNDFANDPFADTWYDTYYRKIFFKEKWGFGSIFSGAAFFRVLKHLANKHLGLYPLGEKKSVQNFKSRNFSRSFKKIVKRFDKSRLKVKKQFHIKKQLRFKPLSKALASSWIILKQLLKAKNSKNNAASFLPYLKKQSIFSPQRIFFKYGKLSKRLLRFQELPVIIKVSCYKKDNKRVKKLLALNKLMNMRFFPLFMKKKVEKPLLFRPFKASESILNYPLSRAMKSWSTTLNLLEANFINKRGKKKGLKMIEKLRKIRIRLFNKLFRPNMRVFKSTLQENSKSFKKRFKGNKPFFKTSGKLEKQTRRFEKLIKTKILGPDLTPPKPKPKHKNKRNEFKPLFKNLF